MSLCRILPGCFLGILKIPFCCFTRSLPPLRIFLRLFSQYWHGEVAEVVPWSHLSFFFSLLTLVWKCACHNTLGNIPWLCSCHYCLCGVLRDARFFLPLLPLSLPPAPKWTQICCLLRNLTVPEATGSNSGDKSSFSTWFLGFQADAVKRTIIFCSALATEPVLRGSLFLHTKQRWLFITSAMSKLPRQSGHKTCWISSVDDEGTSSSCAIWSH